MPMPTTQAASYTIDFDALNVELLAKVRDAIAAEPTKFEMAAVMSFTDHDLDYQHWTEFYPTDLTHGCETAACIAGWAIALSTEPGQKCGVSHEAETWQDVFGRLSGMPIHPDALVIPLCFTGDWPSWTPASCPLWPDDSGIIISLDEHDTAVLLLDLILDRKNPWHMDGAEVMAWRAARLVP